MELTSRQKESIDDLKNYQGITEVDDIIKWCLLKLSLPNRKNKSGGRKHSKEHYQGILEHYLEKKKKLPRLAQLREEAKNDK